MGHDDNAVFRDRAIELESVDADLDRALKAGERVFRKEPARSSVTLQLQRRYSPPAGANAVIFQPAFVFAKHATCSTGLRTCSSGT